MPTSTTRPLRARRTVVAATVAAVGAAAVVAAPAPVGAATSSLTVFGGYGYASAAGLGSLVNSGGSAVTQMCTRQGGLVRTNKTAALTIPGVGSVGAVQTALRSTRNYSGSAVRSDSDTAATSLLSALSFTAMHTTARVIRSSRGAYTMSASTTIVNGKLAGHALPAAPTRDQTLSIPGVAKLIFNHQAYFSAWGMRRVGVVGLQIIIGANNVLHLPAGSILVGRSIATLHNPVHANPYGSAWGTVVNVANVAGSGRTAAVYLPCGGSGGQVMKNRIVRAQVSQAITSGVVYSTGYSSDNATRTLARTTSNIAGVSLLGGVITARAINVAAQTTRNSRGVLTRSSTGTSVAGLTIKGTSRSGGVPANTRINIPGVGTLYGNRVIRTRWGVQVIGLQLVLSVTRNGLKSGTVVTIGQASAGVTPN